MLIYKLSRNRDDCLKINIIFRYFIEATFVKKNKEKWQLFEDALYRKTIVSPDKLYDLYI